MTYKIFITGAKQIGKSTLINKIIEDLNIGCVGFKTSTINYQTHKVCLFNSLIKPITKQNNQLIAKYDFETNEFSSSPEVFETLGVECLKLSLETKNLIIMDEIGRVENNCINFIEQINIALNSKNNILGVLQEGDIDFHQNIFNHEDVIIYKLTQDNFEDVYLEITKKIKGK